MLFRSEGSRGSFVRFLQDMLTNEEANEKVRRLQPIAEELDASLAQLAFAWCAANPNVSTVITGASNLEQVNHNMAAKDLIEQLDEDVLGRIDEIFG